MTKFTGHPKTNIYDFFHNKYADGMDNADNPFNAEENPYDF